MASPRNLTPNLGVRDRKNLTWKEFLLEQIILFAGCVLFPGLVTFIAPASWITFKRSDASVNCTAKTCVFFIVPFRTQQVDHVQEISKRSKEARTERKRQAGRTTTETVHVDGEGFLQVIGRNDQIMEVSVSPASLERVLSKANAFINASNPDKTTLFVIANWKFGAIMGGILTSFTALYVIGFSLEFCRLIFLWVVRFWK